MASDPIRILIVDDDEGVWSNWRGSWRAKAVAPSLPGVPRGQCALRAASVSPSARRHRWSHLFHELQRNQATAFRLLMHTRKDLARKSVNSAGGVCKWSTRI